MYPLLAAAALLLPAPSGVAAGGPADATAAPAAVWEFGAGEDRDFDRWPDGWLRRRGAAFPHFVPVEIDRAAGALWIAANGGAAAAYSPPVRLVGRPAVRLTARVRTEGLDEGAAVVSLSLLDVHRVRLARFLTPPVSGTSAAGGRLVEIEPVPPAPGAAWAVVGCHLVPGAAVSVGGAAWFDDLTLTSEPFLSLERLDGGPTITPGETTRVRVSLSGVPEGTAAPALAVTLRNADDPSAVPVTPPLVTTRAGTEATAVAALAPPAPGLWEVTATAGTGATARSRTLSIAVAEPVDRSFGSAAGTSRYGWTLDAAPAADAARLAEFAAAAGAGWVRWTAGDSEADERFAAAVRARRMRPVVRVTATSFGGRESDATADAHAALPDAGAVLERLVKPLAVHVRHWQLGADREPRAQGRLSPPTLGGLLKAAAPGVLTVGSDEAGAERRLLVDAAPGPQTAWRALSATADPDAFLWNLIEAGAAGSGPIFAADAREPGSGLLTPDGSPTRRFLPFRTVAGLLGEGSFLGRVRLPAAQRRGEPDALAFQTPAGPVLAVRGATPGATSLWLGGEPLLRNPLGRASRPPAVGGAHRIEWSEEPAFLSGMDERLLRLRLGTDLAAGGGLRSSPEPQTLGVRVVNPDGEAGRFTVALDCPEGWECLPKQHSLTIPAGSRGVAAFTLTLPPNVSLGEHPLVIRLTPHGGTGGTLRIPRTPRVRLDGLRLDVTDRRLPGGGWEVTQTLVNELPDGSTPAFRCEVQVPGAARVGRRTDPLTPGAHRLVHLLPDGLPPGEPVWLRCAEIDGARVLNRRWTLGDPPRPSQPPPSTESR